MVGEQPVHLLQRVGIPGLEPLGGARVQRVPAFGDERAIGALLDQRVLEAVLGLGPAALLPHEVEPLQLEQRPGQIRAVADHAREQRQAEAAADHRAGEQHVVAVGVQPVDPRQDHLLDRRRQLDRHLPHQLPAAVALHECPGVGHRAQQLLDVEGVALPRLQHARANRRREALEVGQGGEQLLGGGAGERLQRQLRQPVGKVARRGLADTLPAMVSLGASGHDHQQRRALDRPQQPLHQGQRGGVRPVQVFQKQRHRAVLGKLGQPVLDHLEGAVLQRLGRELGDPGLGFGLQRQAEQRTEVRVQRCGPLAHQRFERSPQRHPHAQVGLVQTDAQPAAQEIAKRPVRHRLAVAHTPPLQPAGVPMLRLRRDEHLAQLGGQAGSCPPRARRRRPQSHPTPRARHRPPPGRHRARGRGRSAALPRRRAGRRLRPRRAPRTPPPAARARAPPAPAARPMRTILRPTCGWRSTRAPIPAAPATATGRRCSPCRRRRRTPPARPRRSGPAPPRRCSRRRGYRSPRLPSRPRPRRRRPASRR